MTADEIVATLDDDACLFEPRSTYDAALVDSTDTPDDDWPRSRRLRVAVYDFWKLVEIHGGDDNALDTVSYSFAGAYLGDGTPVIWYGDEVDDDG